MYGRKRYGRDIKPVEQPIVPALPNNSDPTFICAKCKTVKNMSLGYADITFTAINNKTKPRYRICHYCIDLLTIWMKV
jgi:hypothetical protein